MSTWLKLSNTLPTDDKVLDCSVPARYLYVVALCHSSNNLTDGHLKRSVVPVLHGLSGTDASHVDELVDVGLWLSFDDGYGIANYLDQQQSKESVDAKRKADAERQARRRRSTSRRDTDPDSQEDTDPVSRRDTDRESGRNPDGVRPPDEMRLDEIRTPSLSAQDAIAAPGLSTGDVWIEAHNAGIPQRVISRARSDYDGSPDPTPGALADHIATRYTPAATKAELDDHYRKHGSPSLAQAPLKALAHRTGWANKRQRTTPAA